MPKDTNTLTVVRALILNESNKVLVLKRTPTRLYNKNKWELPGGKIIEGETLDDAIHKKVGLETGAVIRINSADYFCQSRVVNEVGKYKDFIYIEICAYADFVGGDIDINPLDHTDYKWQDISQVGKLDLANESKKALYNYMYKTYILPKKQKKTEIVVKALIKKGGKYLALRRASDGTLPNKWELPGGKLDSFEYLEESLKREVFEETGLLVAITKPALRIASQTSNHVNFFGLTFVNVLYECTLIKGTVKLSTDHQEFMWATPKELLALDLAPNMSFMLNEVFLT